MPRHPPLEFCALSPLSLPVCRRMAGLGIGTHGHVPCVLVDRCSPTLWYAYIVHMSCQNQEKRKYPKQNQNPHVFIVLVVCVHCCCCICIVVHASFLEYMSVWGQTNPPEGAKSIKSTIHQRGVVFTKKKQNRSFESFRRKGHLKSAFEFQLFHPKQAAGAVQCRLLLFANSQHSRQVAHIQASLCDHASHRTIHVTFVSWFAIIFRASSLAYVCDDVCACW